MRKSNKRTRAWLAAILLFLISVSCDLSAISPSFRTSAGEPDADAAETGDLLAQDKVVLTPSEALLLATPTSSPSTSNDITPVETQSAQPPTIPQRTLSPDGPWYAFLADDGIWALNPDGSGLTHLVDDIVVAPIDLKAGAKGSTLAFVTADNAFNLRNLTLKLLKLPEGSVETITPLLAPGNQPAENPKVCDPKYEAARAVKVYNGLSWSADGSKLAFIGAIDGPTADLYVYRPADGSITRLTDGPSQAYGVNWSLRDDYIIHFGVSCFGTGAGFNMTGAWAADPDTGDVIDLYTPGQDSYGEEFANNYWSAGDAFFVVTHSGCPARDLRMVDMQTREVTMVHEGCFWDYRVYPPEIIAVLSGADFSDQPGLYLYSPEAPFQLLKYIPFENGQELGRFGNMFMVKNIDHSKPLHVISSVNIPDGSPGWYQGQGEIPLKHPATDRSYAWSEDDNFYFLREGAAAPVLLSDRGARFPYWVEDISGPVGDITIRLLYFTGIDPATLYIASEPDFIPVPVGEGLMPRGEFIWLFKPQ